MICQGIFLRQSDSFGWIDIGDFVTSRYQDHVTVFIGWLLRRPFQHRMRVLRNPVAPFANRVSLLGLNNGHLNRGSDLVLGNHGDVFHRRGRRRRFRLDSDGFCGQEKTQRPYQREVRQQERYDELFSLLQAGCAVIASRRKAEPPLLIVGSAVGPLDNVRSVGGAAAIDVGHLAAVNGGELETILADRGDSPFLIVAV